MAIPEQLPSAEAQIHELRNTVPDSIDAKLVDDPVFIHLVTFVLEDFGGFLSVAQLADLIRSFTRMENLPFMADYGADADPKKLNRYNLEEFVTTLVAAHTTYALRLHQENKRYPLRRGYAKELHDMEIQLKGF